MRLAGGAAGLSNILSSSAGDQVDIAVVHHSKQNDHFSVNSEEFMSGARRGLDFDIGRHTYLLLIVQY